MFTGRLATCDLVGTLGGDAGYEFSSGMADMGLAPFLRSLFGLKPDKVTRLKAPNAQAAPRFKGCIFRMNTPMSQLTALIAQAQAGLSVQQNIPQERWEAIATQCGAEEIAEIKTRIASLKAAREAVEDWDGDTRDDLYFAIAHFTRLLELASAHAQGQ